MKSLRLIFLLFLSFGLSLGEASASFMQAQMAGSRSITICSPDGTREVQIGASGKPVPSGKHKHSCCLFATTAVTPAETRLPHRTIRREPTVVVADKTVCLAPKRLAKARSPPEWFIVKSR